MASIYDAARLGRCGGNADLALGRIEGNDPNADTEPLA